ncbi:asparaginase [soil metagenome]
MTNPQLAEVTRGGIVESSHRGSYVVSDARGGIVLSAGDIAEGVFPRSAIKAFQCLPVIESGTADAYGFSDEDIALCCSSHNGEPAHVAVARGMLAKAGEDEAHYECGAHWPSSPKVMRDLARSGAEPGSVHNNCSGKHAGMLALAKMLGVSHEGYVKRQHPVQRAVAQTLSELTGIDVDSLPCGIDGCSVPTWAVPLQSLALAFARFASGEGLSPQRRAAAGRIIAAVRAHPFMVAGSDRFCTKLMTAVPRAFVKTGAEGVFCGAIPHAGLGIALKCDDGASRASETAFAGVLASLDVWSADERLALAAFAHVELTNWRGLSVGAVQATTLP